MKTNGQKLNLAYIWGYETNQCEMMRLKQFEKACLSTKNNVERFNMSLCKKS
jgi:hypothetical protein